MALIPELIIFDCDGTLVDSETVNNIALLEVINEICPHQYDLNHAYHHWMGKTVSTILLQIQMETGYVFTDPDIAQKYIAKVNHMYTSELRPVDGALEVVRACQQKTKTCVASNGERGNVIYSLTLCGFMPEYFQETTIFTKTQVARPKPAPDLFLYAAHQRDADPARTIVVEDSVAGVQAGVAAGMSVIGFTGTSHDPVSQEKRLRAAGATHVISRLIHINQYVNY
jgi:HAD superfamily hydrolase (TIGR01509 family)